MTTTVTPFCEVVGLLAKRTFRGGRTSVATDERSIEESSAATTSRLDCYHGWCGTTSVGGRSTGIPRRIGHPTVTYRSLRHRGSRVRVEQFIFRFLARQRRKAHAWTTRGAVSHYSSAATQGRRLRRRAPNLDSPRFGRVWSPLGHRKSMDRRRIGGVSRAEGLTNGARRCGDVLPRAKSGGNQARLSRVRPPGARSSTKLTMSTSSDRGYGEPITVTNRGTEP